MNKLALLVPALMLSACGGGSGGGIAPAVTASPATTVSAAELNLQITPVKTFEFSWADTAGATYYRILENADGVSGFTQIGGDINSGVEGYSLTVALYERVNAQYILESCNTSGCSGSSAVSVGAQISSGIGYVKASNTGANDKFGTAMSLSDDGTTLAVSASGEASNAGAVYMFKQSAGLWIQTAYLQASNAQASDFFGDSFASRGSSLSLSDDGNTLAVGAYGEGSNATGVNGIQSDNSMSNAGAVYIFENNGSWAQTAYLKASNPSVDDRFGASLSLSGDASTLVVAAEWQDSGQTNAGSVYVFENGVSGWTQKQIVQESPAGFFNNFGSTVSVSDDGATFAVGVPKKNNADDGAVYVFENNGTSWAQTAALAVSNPSSPNLFEQFGLGLSLSGNGLVLAIGAPYEDSNATGVDGDESDNSATDSGAVYLFEKTTSWTQSAYIKASTVSGGELFGKAVDLDTSGTTLIVGAQQESTISTGLNGDESSLPAVASDVNHGAAYLFASQDGTWAQVAFLKALNTEKDDNFGNSVSLSGDGNTVAVGAFGEDSNATGINGDNSDNSVSQSGAVYLY